MVADAISRLPTTNQNQKERSTEAQDLPSKTLDKTKMFILDDEKFPLDLFLVQRTQNKELKERKSKFKQLVNDTASNYNIMELDGHQLVGMKGDYMSLLP